MKTRNKVTASDSGPSTDVVVGASTDVHAETVALAPDSVLQDDAQRQLSTDLDDDDDLEITDSVPASNRNVVVDEATVDSVATMEAELASIEAQRNTATSKRCLACARAKQAQEADIQEKAKTCQEDVAVQDKASTHLDYVADAWGGNNATSRAYVKSVSKRKNVRCQACRQTCFSG